MSGSRHYEEIDLSSVVEQRPTSPAVYTELDKPQSSANSPSGERVSTQVNPGERNPIYENIRPDNERR